MQWYIDKNQQGQTLTLGATQALQNTIRTNSTWKVLGDDFLHRRVRLGYPLILKKNHTNKKTQELCCCWQFYGTQVKAKEQNREQFNQPRGEEEKMKTV